MYWTPLIKMFRKALDSLLVSYRLQVTNRRLQALDDHVLKDIGLHRSEIGSILWEMTRDSATAPERRLRVAAKGPAPPYALAGPEPEPIA
jgi:uncharacterized protein YjiS (DUF1127 family)